jgi:hypothetical protein
LIACSSFPHYERITRLPFPRAIQTKIIPFRLLSLSPGRVRFRVFDLPNSFYLLVILYSNPFVSMQRIGHFDIPKLNFDVPTSPGRVSFSLRIASIRVLFLLRVTKYQYVILFLRRKTFLSHIVIEFS